MQVINLKLNRYERFKLGVFESIDYTPESNEQIILGSNGSGKSSLLSEIYNIVPSANDFNQGGSKEQTLRHNGKFYRIISSFKNKSPHYSFEESDDGESWINLNDSGTQSQQRELVKEILGLDQALIDLMTGKIKLSTMDSNTRRQWMMRIADTDFSYVNKIHKYLKEKFSDYRGTGRILAESLADISRDLEVAKGEGEIDENEVTVLQNIINTASSELENIGRIDLGTQLIKQKLSDVLFQIESLGILIKTIFNDKPENFRYVNTENVMMMNADFKKKYTMLEGRQQEVAEELRKIQEAIDHIGRENIEPGIDVEERINNLVDEVGDILEKPSNEDIGVLERKLGSIEIAIGRLQSIVFDFPDVGDFEEFKRRTQADRSRLEAINPRLNELNNSILNLNGRVSHYEHTEDVDCPTCKTRFKPGLSKELFDKFVDAIKRFSEEQSQLLHEQGEINLRLQTADEFNEKVRIYRQIKEQHSDLSDIWKTIADKRLLTTYPALIMDELKSAKTNIEHRIHRLHMAKELERLMMVKAISMGNAVQLLENAEEKENALFKISEELKDLSNGIRSTETVINKSRALEVAMQSFDKFCHEHQRLSDMLAKSTYRDYLLEVRKQASSRTGILHQTKEKFRSLSMRAETLSEQLNSAKEKFEVYKLLTKATSPTEGIVADIIKAFMDRFLGLLNYHLSRVWSYDFKVTQAIDNGQPFTCRFPFQVGSDDKLVADVSDGSTGQVSMVDFAFKLVVFKLEGLKGYPLLADEFGGDFDDEHREHLVNYIHELLDGDDFGQLFMTSHYASVYGAFDQAEFVVLDDRNIVKPTEYNLNITFA